MSDIRSGLSARVTFTELRIALGANASPKIIIFTGPTGVGKTTVRAIDSLGAVTTSVPRTITVTANQGPAVTLTSPTAGTVGIAPASFTLTANATDSDGTIATVEFFNGSTLIGTATAAPYSLAWDNVAPGNYSLTAQATDNLGLQTTSTPINVSVIANSLPAISLTSPTPNQSFKAPASITLTASASDPDNNLAKVEFFQNGNLIATVLTPPYTAIWNNVGQGSYQITAIATDAIGAQTSSAPTTITVTPTQASLYFIQADHLGTPRLVTDEQNAIVWRHLPTTEPFGNTLPEEDPQATGTRFEMNLAFPGQYRDRESGLSYNFFRDYNPATGSYPQSDPIGLAGGINTYGYVNGNPVSFVDPSGESPQVVAAGLVILGGFALNKLMDAGKNVALMMDRAEMADAIRKTEIIANRVCQEQRDPSACKFAENADRQAQQCTNSAAQSGANAAWSADKSIPSGPIMPRWTFLK